MMDERSINKFLKKYADNSYTDQEHQLFIDWLNSAPLEQIEEVLRKYQDLVSDKSKGNDVQPELIANIERKLDQYEEESEQANKVVPLWTKYRKIACIAALFFMVISFFFYFSTSTDPKQPMVVKTDKTSEVEISPGGNKAVLTLATGVSFVLDNTKSGVLYDEFGLRARKIKEGQVIFDPSTTNSSSISLRKNAYNSITTPRGGQYQVILPDGTKVWLNAASSLRFANFFPEKERVVELNGEAYFEVEKLTSHRNGKNIPFKVRSGNHLVEVLGTHFNVKAYSDEASVTTTLLEGSVKVSGSKGAGSRLLKPGQQARAGSLIKVSDVDAKEAIAWKDGYFNFSHENIESIMRNISRWYDVEVRYEKNVTKEGFVGSVSKYQHVSQVLEMLQLTGAVKFKTEGRRITVMP